MKMTSSKLSGQLPSQSSPPSSTESVWTIIKSETREAALSTTIHGLGGIYRSKLLVIKIVWLLLFLASSSYCAYTIVLNIKSYLEFEVVTNIYTDLDIPAVFPKVTICNENPVTTEFGLNFSESILEPTIVEGSKLDPLEAISRRFNVLINARAQLGSEAEKIGLTLQDMLISCSFASRRCNSSDFVYSFSMYYGNCYSFNNGHYANGSRNSNVLASVTKAGALDGLFLELYTGYPTSPYSMSISSGLHLFIDNQTVFNSIFDGLSISQSESSSIVVTKTFSENLPKPYSECTADDDIKNSDSELVQLMLSTRFKYRFIDCIDMCYVKHVIDRCGCQDGSFVAEFENISACTNVTQVNCAIDTYITFYEKDVKSFCADQCPLECDNVDYTLSVSSTAYPTYSHYLDLVEDPVVQKNFGYNRSAMTYEAVKSSVLCLFVNYGDLSYTRIHKDPKMTLLDLISQIGGVAGLFVGASFMSFFEVVELAIVVITLLFERNFATYYMKVWISKKYRGSRS